MLINLITNITDKNNKDHVILSQLFNSQHHSIMAYDYRHTIMRDSDISIHLEFINPIALTKSNLNILITSANSNVERLVPYMSKLDIVFGKTNEAVDFFRQYHNKVKYMGWTAWDKLNNNEFRAKKHDNYYTFVNNSNFDDVFKVAQNWKGQSKFHIYSKLDLDKTDLIMEFVGLDNVEIFESGEPQNESIFVSFSESDFDAEQVAESSTGSIIICPKSELFNRHKSQYNYNSIEELEKQIEKIDKLDVDEFSKRSALARGVFIDNQHDFLKNFTHHMTKVLQLYKSPDEETLDENRPLISVITLTYNRPKMVDLFTHSFGHQDYPNLEWIVVNDSDIEYPPIEGAKIITLNKKHSIWEKRNIGCDAANGDYIFMMDDDDYYPATSISTMMKYLNRSGVDCIFCSSIACFDVRRKASIINTPHIFDYPWQRVSEATLLFKKSFWEERNFSESSDAEGINFIKDRYNKCAEYDWRGVIISINHGYNISTRKIPIVEPNGNHFVNDEWGFRDETLKIIDSL